MARRVFYSFHYKPDSWRAAKVRNIGAIEGNQPVSDNDWETITKGGASTIEKWINEQLAGRSCAVVLIGANTANRKWINYEIDKAWNSGKGVLGIHIHNLEDSKGNQCAKGKNPFDYIKHTDGRTALSFLVKVYDPPFVTSAYVYNYIRENLPDWVEESIRIRSKY